MTGDVRRRWPQSLDEAMLCQNCGAQVDWRTARRTRKGPFDCPNCGAVRLAPLAGLMRRNQVGVRDGWICHRCGQPIDRELPWRHPLAAVADHYPISRGIGGPPIMANLKIAHALCNGDDAPYEKRLAAYLAKHDLTSEQRELVATIARQPRDRGDHILALSQRPRPDSVSGGVEVAPRRCRANHPMSLGYGIRPDGVRIQSWTCEQCGVILWGHD